MREVKILADYISCGGIGVAAFSLAFEDAIAAASLGDQIL